MIKTFFLTLIVFLGIDAIWLGIVAKEFYDKALQPFARTLNLPAALAAYLVICLGLTIFVLPQAKEKSYFEIFLSGAILGLALYGTYDFSNLATLTHWSLKTTIVDICWGMFICASVSALVKLISSL